MKRKKILKFMLLPAASFLLFAVLCAFGLFDRNIDLESSMASSSLRTGRELASVKNLRLNLNRADADSLSTLPGFGETLAEQIVQWREKNGPFSDYEQLGNIEGIGQQRMEVLREYTYLEE